jgi:hypothetical protein
MLTYSGLLCGILFGIGFWSVARFVSHARDVRDYMILTAYGFIIFFTAGGAAVLQAGYPPFGLANVSFVGLSSFLILIGVYRSAISVAHDTKLRKSIKDSVLKDSKLLDSIGSVQMIKEIENKAISATKANADLFAEQSGIEPSLTDGEIKQYVEHVIDKVKVKQG